MEEMKTHSEGGLSSSREDIHQVGEKAGKEACPPSVQDGGICIQGYSLIEEPCSICKRSWSVDVLALHGNGSRRWCVLCDMDMWANRLTVEEYEHRRGNSCYCQWCYRKNCRSGMKYHVIRRGWKMEELGSDNSDKENEEE